MRSARCIISVLCILSCSHSAEEKKHFESWKAQRIQGLEATVQRLDCQRYLAHGYKFEHMYAIDGVAFDNVVIKRPLGQLTYFEMHLAIKAARDGIIILSPKAYPGADDLVFEIGVGISANQFTILRLTKDSKNEVTRVNTQNILSTTQYTKFYLKISDDLLMFGKEGDSPLISYQDQRLRTVKYFDMSAWGDGDAKFLYDCPETAEMYCYYKSP